MWVDTELAHLRHSRDEVFNLVVMDQIKSAVRSRLVSHLDDRKIKKWDEVGPVLNSYVLLQGESFGKHKTNPSSFNRGQRVTPQASYGSAFIS
ncbi:hypothetical protein E2C01_062136 [Portunus trituberculatus]|uniref:Uncharacterized protein n=1 Tax=Portunus trituberculatus TaxID=210409 RepID=A0A5B7HDQ9_PORTR|nr:hypothetical protein [Portunus trituberculatus]